MIVCHQAASIQYYTVSTSCFNTALHSQYKLLQYSTTQSVQVASIQHYTVSTSCFNTALHSQYKCFNTIIQSVHTSHYISIQLLNTALHINTSASIQQYIQVQVAPNTALYTVITSCFNTALHSQYKLLQYSTTLVSTSSSIQITVVQFSKHTQ